MCVSLSLLYTRTQYRRSRWPLSIRKRIMVIFSRPKGADYVLLTRCYCYITLFFFSNLSKPYAIPFVFGINHRGSIIIIIDLRDWSFRLRLTKLSWIWLEELFRCQTYYYNTVVEYNINITTVTMYIVVLHYILK